MKGGRECLACPPTGYQDQGNQDTLSLVREIRKLGDVAYFGEFYKLGKNLLLNLEDAS